MDMLSQLIVMVSLVWWSQALCPAKKSFVQINQVAPTEREFLEKMQIFLDTQTCFVHGDIESLLDCMQYCNDEEQCVGLAQIKRQCHVCHFRDTQGNPIPEVYRERFIVSRKHVLSLEYVTDVSQDETMPTILESTTATASTVESAAESTTQLATEISTTQATSSVPELATNVTKSATEQTTESDTAGLTAGPAATSTNEPTESATASTTQLTKASSTRVATESTTEQAVELNTESALESTGTPAAESATEQTTSFTTDTTTDSSTALATESTTDQALAQTTAKLTTEPAEVTGVCASSPCRDGVCVSDETGSYTCDCLDGYRGPNCEVDKSGYTSDRRYFFSNGNRKVYQSNAAASCGDWHLLEIRDDTEFMFISSIVASGGTHYWIANKRAESCVTTLASSERCWQWSGGGEIPDDAWDYSLGIFPQDGNDNNCMIIRSTGKLANRQCHRPVGLDYICGSS